MPGRSVAEALTVPVSEVDVRDPVPVVVVDEAEVVVALEVDDDELDVDELVVVVVVDGASHSERVMRFVSRVTAPLRASSRPSTDAPVCAVIDVKAMTFPMKSEAVPRVAELPTCQNTLHA